MQYKTIETPIGRLTIESCGEFVTRILFECEAPVDVTQGDSPVLTLAAEQLNEYFCGARKVFTVPIKPTGGPFITRVWEIMAGDILFGTVTTYGEVASLAGNAKASRAVGMANNRNPIPIIIPCHRVLGKNGKLTGFRWGLEVKEKLLELEGISF